MGRFDVSNLLSAESSRLVLSSGLHAQVSVTRLSLQLARVHSGIVASGVRGRRHISFSLFKGRHLHGLVSLVEGVISVARDLALLLQILPQISLELLASVSSDERV